jgi:anti-sigma regulatory factor (Ser/Thr protein kinase)
MSAGVGCLHDLLLFGSDAELVAASWGFIADGIAAGDLVIVHGGEHEVELLRDAFDDDPRVVFAPGRERYQHMMGTIGQYQRLCERENAAGRRVRALGPVPFAEDPASRTEWMRYEALIARALGPYGFSGLCHYDTRNTPADVMNLALATHQNVVTAHGVRRNDRQRPGSELLRALAPAHPPDALEDAPAVWGESDCAAPAPVRHGVRRALREGRVDTDQAEGFVAAISEVVSNALQHGQPPVQVHLHTNGHRWLCMVTDQGPGMADPWTGVDSPLPTNPQQVGTGLWLARQLCDQLTITTHPGGGARVSLLITPAQAR